ncbi:MAG: fold metallo-hydrolase [Pseudomonas sp.]|nr:fold metallo-hydrolase [Pseudomonas sp.]
MSRSASYKSLVGTFFLSLAVASTLASAEPTPPIGTQAPGYFRLAVGHYEVAALFDGYNDLSRGLLLISLTCDNHGALS